MKQRSCNFEMRRQNVIWTISLLILWASWWGGLSFYAVVVVPIGTEIIGSVQQGFITQRVTQWHNTLFIALLVCLFVEALRQRSRPLWLLVASLAVINIALVFYHARLTSFMDFSEQTVPDSFYARHALYLWITAAEWILGMAIPIWLFPSLVTAKSRDSNPLDQWSTHTMQSNPKSPPKLNPKSQ